MKLLATVFNPANRFYHELCRKQHLTLSVDAQKKVDDPAVDAGVEPFYFVQTAPDGRVTNLQSFCALLNVFGAAQGFALMRARMAALVAKRLTTTGDRSKTIADVLVPVRRYVQVFNAIYKIASPLVTGDDGELMRLLVAFLTRFHSYLRQKSPRSSSTTAT